MDLKQQQQQNLNYFFLEENKVQIQARESSAVAYFGLRVNHLII